MDHDFHHNDALDGDDNPCDDHLGDDLRGDDHRSDDDDNPCDDDPGDADHLVGGAEGSGIRGGKKLSL